MFQAMNANTLTAMAPTNAIRQAVTRTPATPMTRTAKPGTVARIPPTSAPAWGAPSTTTVSTFFMKNRLFPAGLPWLRMAQSAS